MKRGCGIFYATRNGHTQKIVDYLAAALRARDIETDLKRLGESNDIHPDEYQLVVLASPVHRCQHAAEILKFVKQHREQLDSTTTAFVSVSLSEAGVERPNTTPAEHARFVADVDRVLGRFFTDAHWRPTLIKPVAGALLYTKYNFLVRFVMKQIAKAAGGDTDTSRDFEYTDWSDLDRFAEKLARHVQPVQAQPDPFLRETARTWA